MKILYAEDNEEIASLLIKTIQENFPVCKIIHVRTGKQAIDYLQADIFDLVISDYSMPEQSGGDVLKYIVNNERDENFILITAEKINILPEFKDRIPTESIKILKKPFDQKIIVQTISRLFDPKEVTKVEPLEESSITTYYPVEVERLSNLNTAPCDFFLKLSEKKWIKVINKNGIEIQDIVNKYWSKGIEKIYIQETDLQLFNEAMINRLEDSLALADDVSPTSQMSIVGDTILTIHERLIYFGLKNELVNQANKTIANVLESFKYDRSIENLFNTIKTATKGHLLQHSLMTTYLSNIVIRNLDWYTISNQEKITMASLFHDIALAHSDFQKLEKKSFLVGIDKTDTDVPNEFIAHPQKSVELLSKIPNMPDLFTIILEHHERPDGSGFPRGLKANRISPLSCILIVAHHACELIEFNDSQKEKKNILKSLEDEYKEGHFAQIVQSFKESLN